MSVTVRAALALPELRHGLPSVAAGAAGLDQPIRWVHAGEIPNIAEVLRGGELLLTTGMGIGAAASDQRRFVDELASRGVAALVVELSDAYANGLPRALLAAAERHGLPVIELHAEVQFVAITEAIHTELINHQYDLLRRVEQLNARFTTVMLDGAGIPGVLSLLADAIGNPVFLAASDGRLLHAAAPQSPRAEIDLLRLWGAAANDAFAPRLTVAIPGADGRTSGRLTALPLEATLDAFAEAATEQAASAVALALLRNHQEEELLAHGRGEFLDDLALDRIAPRRLAERARAMGFAGGSSTHLLPIAVEFESSEHDPRAPSGPRVVRTWAQVRDLERRLEPMGLPFLAGRDADGRVLVLLGLREADDRGPVASQVAEACHAIGNGAVVAVGSTATWRTAGEELRRAIRTTAAASAIPFSTWHDVPAVPLARMLWECREQPSARRFVDELLGPLLAHDGPRRERLMSTLETLCAHGGRKAEAARALHVNRQGLYKRIDRLEAILGVDLSDPEVLLSLHLAIRALPFIRLNGDRPSA